MSQETMRELDRIFHPRGVAVIGASKNPSKFGYHFAACLINNGYAPVFPVHPTETEVLGRRVYARVSDIPDPVDLAVLVTPTKAVLEAVIDCGRKGVKGLVIYTSGYREVGEEGRQSEEELAKLAKSVGVRIFGPNCIGIYCPASKLFNSAALPKDSGVVGMISHSGSLTTLLAMLAAPLGLRFSKVISSGNECDINATELLEYLGQDADTKIIVCYLEGIKNGPRFVQVAKEVSKRKPILLWKGGMTERGAKAAASHTGSFAGSRQIWEAVIRQTGIIAVRSLEELLDCLQSFYYLQPPTGRNVVIVSAPGGPAVTTADACVENGLMLADLSAETKRRIAAVVPPTGTSLNNPVDLGQSVMFAPQMYTEALKIVGQDPGVDMILAIGWTDERITPMFVEAKRNITVPFVLAVIGQFDPAAPTVQALYGAGIPVFSDPRRAARALGALDQYRDFVRGTR